ncbi:DUF2922 domain-containing protein [Paratissierella segnis]|uniref:DUF2922 domain-containing protein n=1 Tax=Paratissierella segnis TaxID=2763679 RepID=A0A926ERH9_9FIRM|nr:DUF2922 domain-containing protein [Paratissierella segnis]MBC8587516.1 DUF2922 domain-containing protein [Paratissierella segnis]
MDKVKLEMNFLNVANKIVKISIDDPKEDLNNAEVEDAMDNIVALNIFDSKEGDLVGVSGARVIRTSVSDIEF